MSPADGATLGGVQGAAVLRAQLGDFKQAGALLEKLSASKADDKDVWRLLVRAALCCAASESEP